MNARTRQAWTVLAAATIAQVSTSIVNQGLPTLAPFLRSALHLSRAATGFIATSMYAGGLVATVLAGWAVDVVGERLVLLLGGLLTGVLVAAASYTGTLVWLVALLMLTGFGAAVPTPAGSKAVMSWFPLQQRGVAMGIRQTGVPVGGAVAALLLPPIAAAAGWRAAMLVAGILSVAGAVLCRVLYREEEPPGEETPSAGRGSRPWDVLDRNLAFLAASGGLLVIGQLCLITYLPLYLRETWGVPVVVGAAFLFVAQLASGGGRILWGGVSDRYWSGRRVPVIALCGVSGVLGAFALGHLPAHPAAFWLAVLVGAFGFTGMAWNGLYITLASELAGRQRAGTAAGIVLFTTQIGIIAGPPLFGHFVDVTQSYPLAWSALAATFLVGTLCLLGVREARVPAPGIGGRPAAQASGGGR